MTNINCTLIALNASYVHTGLSVRALAVYANDFYRAQDRPERVRTLELTINQPFDVLRSEVLRHLSPVVGFSCYLWNVELACKLAQAVKLVRPDVRIVFGGAELEGDMDFLQAHPYVDDVLYGEGEQALLNLLQGTNCDAQILPRLSYDLSDLPKAPQIIYYESSRGCPFGCAFCLSGGQSLRFVPEERAIADLTALGNAQVTQVKLIDRTFNARPGRALRIWAALMDLNTVTNYHFEISADLLDEPALALLARAPKHRFQFEIGVQSANAQTLQAINRKNNLAHIASVVQRLKQSDNIHLHLDLIAGLPLEDFASFGRSFDTVLSMRPHMLQLGFLKLLKGSALRQSGDFGAVYADYPPYEILQTDHLSYVDLLRLKRTEKALDRYYNKQTFATVDYLLRQHPSFDFFCALGDAIDRVDVTKTQKALLTLFEFGVQTLHADPAALGALAQYDYLKEQKRSTLLFDLPDASAPIARAFYKDKACAYINCPSTLYHRYCHLHVFDLNMPELMRSGRLVKKHCAMLFDYVDHRALEVVID